MASRRELFGYIIIISTLGGDDVGFKYLHKLHGVKDLSKKQNEIKMKIILIKIYGLSMF